MTKTLEFANAYADMAWRVFPCQPRDKKPLVKWADEATTTKERVREWWTKWPDANIGIMTGKQSGIIVLDIDAGHGGEETLSNILSKYGNLPKTPIAKTGGGGRHIIFLHPQTHEIRNSAGKLGKGLDIRGDGGYIVAPPSIHPSGNPYEWQSDAKPIYTNIAVMPPWLVEMLAKEQEQPQAQKTDGVYSAGMRNQALTSLAGTMKRRNMSHEAIYTALSAENAARCVPALSDSEVRAIVESIGRYSPSAAMPTTHRDRVHAEWSFIRTVYEHPIDVPEFAWLSPEDFSVPSLRQFWFSVRNANDTTQAARESGILAELDSFTDYDELRVSGYAEQIAHLANMERIAKYADGLKVAAMNGDTEKIDRAIVDINKNVNLADRDRIASITNVLDEVDHEIEEREKNPNSIWGIAYPTYPRLSELTGGKQKGELIILAGEPKAGKSWWVEQDGLFTALDGVPVYMWSGELRNKQVVRRMYQLLGVDGRRMKTGSMTQEDKELQYAARKQIENAPLYLDDKPLRLGDLRAMLVKEKDQHGIQQFVLDYAMLINAPGKDEIEKTGNISRELKIICNDLDLSGLLIASVNKSGMDTASDAITKSNIRGSGQQIHDADVVYILTKYHAVGNDALYTDPRKHENMVTLHIAAGRELDHSLPGGVLHYEREDGTPKFIEFKKVTK